MKFLIVFFKQSKKHLKKITFKISYGARYDVNEGQIWPAGLRFDTCVVFMVVSLATSGQKM